MQADLSYFLRIYIKEREKQKLDERSAAIYTNQKTGDVP